MRTACFGVHAAILRGSKAPGGVVYLRSLWRNKGVESATNNPEDSRMQYVYIVRRKIGCRVDGVFATINSDGDLYRIKKKKVGSQSKNYSNGGIRTHEA